MNTAYKDKIIVIAGGASGIGEQLVRQITPDAKLVVILDRNKKAGKVLASALRENVLFIHLEMSDVKAVESTLRDINTSHGPIDYFFNTAGTFMAGEIRDTRAKDWVEIFDRNIQPIVSATTAVYEIMRKNGHGHIINTASSAGLFPVPVMSIYGATKSAVVALTLGLRMEAKSFNIKVSVVCPTIVDTPLYDTAMYAGVDKEKALGYLRERSNVQKPNQTAQKILKKVPKNRAVIHTATSTYAAWVLYRISPSLYLRVASRVFKSYRQTLRTNSN